MQKVTRNILKGQDAVGLYSLLQAHDLSVVQQVELRWSLRLSDVALLCGQAARDRSSYVA